MKSEPGREDQAEPEFAATAMAETTPTEEAGLLIGRYKLLERLGEGGFGTVWLAEQKEPVRRKVALKIIKLGMDTKQVVARFEAERQALAMMDHPNIAKVLDGGSTGNGRPYFVMELVRGIPITQFCDERQMATKTRLDLFIKVCQAIQHAHQKGVIHRDIKPSNVLVTMQDGVPVPKVIDFGIAKATQGELTDKTIHTQYQQFIGTPAYMSPEQAEMSGLDIDTRSDIYSLGVLLYELLVGITPFNARELMASGIDAMRKTIREKEPDRPSTKLATLRGEELTTTAKRRSVDTSKLVNLLRGDLDWIAMKCLEKDRTRRYDTANGLAADLKRHLNDEPVTARPPSAAYRFQKAFRRNRLVFAAGACVLLTLLLGLGISIWQYAGKSRAEREQHRLREQAEAKAREARDAQEQAAQQRDLARERLYESLVREARSIRKARQVGYRREVFDRLRQAIALGTPNADRAVLRGEAAACLGDWVGLDPVDFSNLEDPVADALSADGSLAAIGTLNRRVSLRDTRTGREVAAFELQGIPVSLAFNREGLALFIVAMEQDLGFGQRPKSLRLEKWSLRGNGSWQQEWSRPTAGFTRIAATAQGPVALVLGPSDSYFAVVDMDQDRELARVPVGRRMPWRPIAAISRDRRQLAFFSLEGQSGFDVQLEVWDLASRQSVVVVKPRLGPGYGLAFAPDGHSLAATYDNTLLVYDTARFSTPINMGGSFEGSDGATIGGKAGWLAVPSIQEYAVRLIQPQSGGEVTYLKLPDRPISVRFSEDGSVLLLTHQMGSRAVRLNVEREKVRLEGHQGGVPAVEFSPDGKQLVSTGKDRTLRLWNLAEPGEFRLLGNLPAPGQTLAYTPDGAFLVCGYYNTGDLSIWSMETGKQVRQVNETAAHSGTTWSCAISADGKCLAAIGTGLRVWDLARLTHPGSDPGAAVPPLFSETNGAAGVVFDPSGRRLAYVDPIGSSSESPLGLFIRDMAPEARPSMIATNMENNYIQGLCFLPKSGALAYVTPQREIAIVEPASGRLIRQFPNLEPGETSRWFLANLRASPDESKLAMVTHSGLGVDVRDGTTGKLLYTLPDETGSIWWLAWSPDSQRLAVTRANGEIAIWNLKEVEAQLSQFELQP